MSTRYTDEEASREVRKLRTQITPIPLIKAGFWIGVFMAAVCTFGALVGYLR